jgi:hypothetical protein
MMKTLDDLLGLGVGEFLVIAIGLVIQSLLAKNLRPQASFRQNYEADGLRFFGWRL